MGYSEDALSLRKPRVIELPRLTDRISYVYLDYVRISQDQTGVVAIREDDSGVQLRIPVSSIGFLLLGPGVSVTGPAMVTLHRAGTTVVFTSSQGVSGFALARPLTNRGDWAQAQARCWADENLRLSAARKLYSIQLAGVDLDNDAPLRVLRGVEGAYTKALYKKLAAEHRLGKWRRETDSDKATDTVNPLLNLANSILYGAATSAVGVLGLSPSLGFVHSGASNALLFDLADLYKTRSSIPLAFACAREANAAGVLGAKMRQFLFDNNVLDAMIKLLCDILEPSLGSVETRRDTLIDEFGAVRGHTNYAHDGRDTVDASGEGGITCL